MTKNCIFCRHDSSNSKSLEHIIPESLGNSTLILPAGVVCDKCNNYFSRKVERPFLDSPVIRNLRFKQNIISKKGRYPYIDGSIDLEAPVKIRKLTEDFSIMHIEHSEEIAERLKKKREFSLYLPIKWDKPSDLVVSRFMAKMAFEALVLRFIDSPYLGGQDYAAFESQLDPIRLHAREGKIREWPVSIRRIYGEDRNFLDQHGRHIQTIHETDFLYTEGQELYFIFCLFGLEFVINLGGPLLDGYHNWLELNGGASPLYTGRNSGFPV